MSETSQKRYALLIAADAYTDPALGALCAPQQDVTDLARVLEAPEIGGFTDVVPLVNPDVQAVRKGISDFLRDKRRDDLLLLYFSGHGVIDRADGHFYLAFGETEQEDPSVAGLPADWITRQLDRRKLLRVVVILDCCYSGRFEGTKGADDLDLDAIFNTGYGRVVLTASRASERSWDGNVLSTPEGAPIPHSLFTHYLVEGLETGLGGASAEPFITVDALYEYAYRRVMETAKSRPQTPTKFARQEGSPLVLARNPRPALAPAPLPGTLGRIFISYSPTDGVARAEALYDALAREGVPVWLDRRDVRPGLAPERQVEAALQECRAVLLLLTPDAAAPGCDCEREWRQALRYKKPIVPLLAGGEPPFYLQNRHAFSPEGADWPAALRQYLDWLSGPEGQLQTLRDRRGDAERDLRTADPPEAARIRSEMELLDRQIGDLTARLAHPEQAAQETDLRIRSGLERERQPLAPVGGKVARIINAPPYAPPAHFQDRDTELRLLARYLRDPACRLVTVVGRAGVGKTAMVLKLLKAAENGRLPVLQEGEDERFPVEGILYLSQVIGRPISWPNLYSDLCRLLPGVEAEAATAVYRDPQAPLTAKVQALLAHFAERRVLVLFDNLEDLVDPATRELTDAELAEALTAFLRAPQHGVTLLATTRVAPRALTLVEPGRQHTLELDTGLASPHAEAVLRALDADGSVGLRDAPDALLGQAREATRGYPRALEALYAILSADRYTTLAEVLSRAEEALPENVVAALVGDAYSRLDPAAQQVLQALAVYNRPATPAAVDYLLRPYLPGVDSAPILQRLTVMHFARREGERYSLHPVDRAYAFSRIPP
ncbi:MAG TPA: TIR domain-containing protein, partial [Anaerolineae bacterium]|nr:TIR domain-containing protein [Anaerolineae bacterium]